MTRSQTHIIGCGKEVSSTETSEGLGPASGDLSDSGNEGGMEQPTGNDRSDSKGSKASLGEAKSKESLGGNKTTEAGSKNGRSFKGKEARLRVAAHRDPVDVDTGIKRKADLHTSPKKV